MVAENMACTDRVGPAEFFLCSNDYCSSFEATWAAHHGVAKKIEINTTSLDEYFLQRGIAWPDLIKLDIEGAGAAALRGMARCIREKEPILLVESHNREEADAISDLMKKHNYGIFRVSDSKWIGNPDDVPADVRCTMILSTGDALRAIKESVG